MDPSTLMALGVFGGLAIIGLLAVANSGNATAAMSTAPKLSCGDVAGKHGEAWLEGIARSDAPLESPLTQTPCIFFELTSVKTNIEPELTTTFGADLGSSRIRKRPPAQNWDKVWADAWWIDDGTGTVLIDGEHAEVMHPVVHTENFNVGDPDPRDLRSRYNFERADDVQLMEKLIPIDANVFASGRLATRAQTPRLICSNGSVTRGTSKASAEDGKQMRGLGWGMVAIGVLGFIGFVVITRPDAPATPPAKQANHHP